MSSDENPFKERAIRFVKRHLLIVYIAFVSTVTCVIGILQILGVVA